MIVSYDALVPNEMSIPFVLMNVSFGCVDWAAAFQPFAVGENVTASRIESGTKMCASFDKYLTTALQWVDQLMSSFHMIVM